MFAAKSFLVYALVLAVTWQESLSFSLLTVGAMTHPSLPFVGRNDKSPNKKTASTTVDPSSKARQSLEEFNQLCKQVIEEERRVHYYPYVTEASQRR